MTTGNPERSEDTHERATTNRPDFAARLCADDCRNVSRRLTVHRHQIVDPSVWIWQHAVAIADFTGVRSEIIRLAAYLKVHFQRVDIAAAGVSLHSDGRLASRFGSHVHDGRPRRRLNGSRATMI